MLLPEIKNYEIFRPKMDATKEVLHSIATFDANISPAFPYINAELGGWDYDQNNQVLLLKLADGKWITLYPQKIAIRGARDLEESRALLVWIKEQINDIYARRDEIEPRHTSQAGLKIMEILKLLPMTTANSVASPPVWPTPRRCGKGRSVSRTARPCGRKNTGTSGKSWRLTWKVTAGAPWTPFDRFSRRFGSLSSPHRFSG